MDIQISESQALYNSLVETNRWFRAHPDSSTRLPEIFINYFKRWYGYKHNNTPYRCMINRMKYNDIIVYYSNEKGITAINLTNDIKFWQTGFTSHVIDMFRDVDYISASIEGNAVNYQQEMSSAIQRIKEFSFL